MKVRRGLYSFGLGSNNADSSNGDEKSSKISFKNSSTNNTNIDDSCRKKRKKWKYTKVGEVSSL